MRTITIEEFHEFNARHSINGKPLRFRHLIIWPDGAFCFANDAERRYEPPEAGSMGLLEALRDYHTVALAEAEAQYKRVEAIFCRDAEYSQKYSDWAGSVPENADEILDGLEAAVVKEQETLAAIKVKLESPERGETDAQRINRLEGERLQRIRNIQLRMLHRHE